MENIFENAYFGKAYKTRYGRKAIFYKGIFSAAREKANYVQLLLEENDDIVQGMHRYYLDGKAHDGHDYLDIVSEWQPEINEGELDRLATEALENINPTKALNKIEAFDWGFKAGYRKALEG